MLDRKRKQFISAHRSTPSSTLAATRPARDILGAPSDRRGAALVFSSARETGREMPEGNKRSGEEESAGRLTKSRVRGEKDSTVKSRGCPPRGFTNALASADGGQVSQTGQQLTSLGRRLEQQEEKSTAEGRTQTETLDVLVPPLAQRVAAAQTGLRGPFSPSSGRTRNYLPSFPSAGRDASVTDTEGDGHSVTVPSGDAPPISSSGGTEGERTAEQTRETREGGEMRRRPSTASSQDLSIDKKQADERGSTQDGRETKDAQHRTRTKAGADRRKGSGDDSPPKVTRRRSARLMTSSPPQAEACTPSGKFVEEEPEELQQSKQSSPEKPHSHGKEESLQSSSASETASAARESLPSLADKGGRADRKRVSVPVQDEEMMARRRRTLIKKAAKTGMLQVLLFSASQMSAASGVSRRPGRCTRDCTRFRSRTCTAT